MGEGSRRSETAVGLTESLYFEDPGGNGIEVYVDASDVWRREPQQVAQLLPVEL
jgi:catechol-2,3-dioxygenase